MFFLTVKVVIVLVSQVPYASCYSIFMGLIYRRDRLLGQAFQVLPESRQLIWVKSVYGLVDFCSCRN